MYNYIKRLLDFIFALLLIILFLPFFIFIPMLIWITMGWPSMFTQKRIGLNNREFRIYKFRSMRHKSGKYNTDAQRITGFGRFLRVSRIDEFPQLFNILIGDMSFIGPRPLLPEYLPYYTKEEIRRHQIRPGLSGLSQVNNLANSNWDEQFKDDIKYVNKMSLKLDVWILIKTILRIIQPATMSNTSINPRPDFITYCKNKQ